MGCSPPHFTLRRRQGSQEKALFLVALAELATAPVVACCGSAEPLEIVMDAGGMLGKGSSGDSSVSGARLIFFGRKRLPQSLTVARRANVAAVLPRTPSKRVVQEDNVLCSRG